MINEFDGKHNQLQQVLNERFGVEDLLERDLDENYKHELKKYKKMTEYFVFQISHKKFINEYIINEEINSILVDTRAISYYRDNHIKNSFHFNTTDLLRKKIDQSEKPFIIFLIGNQDKKKINETSQ